MSEKCPKCGAEVLAKTNGEVNTYITFKCGTSRLNDEDHRQSRDCRIAELENEVERMREGLRPFAKRLENFKEDWGDADTFEKITGKTETYVRLADLRRASALLKGEKTETKSN